MVNQVANNLFNRIVIPLDGSTQAQQVFDYLPTFSSPEETELILVRVIEPLHYTYLADGMLMPDVTSHLRDAANNYLEKESALLKEQGYQVSEHIIQGEAAGEILNLAASVKADLIAMTTHGRSGISRWALGSVAERILHGSEVPVLLVSPVTELPRHDSLRRILVPLDGSKMAEQALPTAVALAQKSNAELMLVRAVQTLDETNRGILFPNEKEADIAFAKYRARADSYLVEMERLLRFTGVAANHRTLLADPSTAICDATVEANVDLIVLSTHGRTGIGRWYYGSVANKVIRSVDCPVLLVRSREQGMTQSGEIHEVLDQIDGLKHEKGNPQVDVVSA